MDVVTLVLAKKGAKKYTDEKFAAISEGLNYQGSVPNAAALETKTKTKGHAWNVTDGSGMYVCDGTNWTPASKQGPQGPKGDKGDKGDPGQAGSQVSVSPTGTSTNLVNYITIDGVESKLSSEAFKPMKSAWTSSSLTTAQAAAMILADPEVKAGDAFAGGVSWSDLYEEIGLYNGEATARVGDGKQFILFTMSSSDTEPYEWNWNSYANVWRSYVPIYDNVQSTVTTAALSANMGKNLQDQITNLQNIGRFLAIWNATIGKPTTEPTSTLPYTYRTGDYYRVGVVGGSRHIHQLTMMGTTTESTGYTASFGFIDDTSSSYTTFTNIAQKLYALGHRTTIDGLECTYTIGSTTRSSNGFVYSPNANGDMLVFEYYEGQSYYEEGRATTVNTATDSVSAAYAHDINIEGTSSSSPSAQVYIDHLAFPSTVNTAYTSVADIAQVLQRLHYSEDFPCFCGGQVGSTSIYLCYGSGNELVLMNNIRSEVGRIATSSTINDTVTSTGVTNYKPDGTTYTGRASTVVETEELEVGAVYYFDGAKWVLQKSGSGGKVQDVQINGTTILDLTSGIANIPIASGSSAGVGAVNSSFGITVTGRVFSAVSANAAEIAAKTQQYKPITPSMLDSSIKAGLGNYTGTAFTDTEKATAKTTLGVHDYTVTVDI